MAKNKREAPEALPVRDKIVDIDPPPTVEQCRINPRIRNLAEEWLRHTGKGPEKDGDDLERCVALLSAAASELGMVPGYILFSKIAEHFKDLRDAVGKEIEVMQSAAGIKTVDLGNGVRSMLIRGSAPDAVDPVKLASLGVPLDKIKAATVPGKEWKRVSVTVQ